MDFLLFFLEGEGLSEEDSTSPVAASRGGGPEKMVMTGSTWIGLSGHSVPWACRLCSGGGGTLADALPKSPRAKTALSASHLKALI